jgi:hypothetical protein
VPTLHLRLNKDCIVVYRDGGRVVHVGRTKDCQGPHRVEEKVDAKVYCSDSNDDTTSTSPR